MLRPSFTSALSLLVLTTMGICHASNEVLGPVYPIIEPNLLEMLQKHALESEKEMHQQTLKTKENLKHWAKAPKGLVLPRATEIQYRSTPINTKLPMMDSSYRRDWLFIDAHDAQQVQLGIDFLTYCKNPVHCRIILTNGPLALTQEKLQTRLCFDQGARLVSRLDIKTVPTLITLTSTSIDQTTAPAKRFPLAQLFKESLK